MSASSGGFSFPFDAIISVGVISSSTFLCFDALA
jgi:hypothetical protein